MALSREFASTIPYSTIQDQGADARKTEHEELGPDPSVACPNSRVIRAAVEVLGSETQVIRPVDRVIGNAVHVSGPEIEVSGPEIEVSGPELRVSGPAN